MDLSKVVIQYKTHPKGDKTIAYCNEYPQLQGIGKSQDEATANFWRAYNAADNRESHLETLSKKEKEALKAPIPLHANENTKHNLKHNLKHHPKKQKAA